MSSHSPRIIVDSNVLYNCPDLNSPKFLKVERMAKSLHWTIAFPDVVIHELARQESKQFAESRDMVRGALEKAPKALRKVLELDLEVGDFHKSYNSKTDGLQSFEECLDHLRDECSSRGFEILPIPAKGIAPAFSDYIRVLKPFKANGTGLADWIIWQSIIETSQPGWPTYLITNNTSDFCEKKDGRHQISEQLASQIPSGCTVDLYTSFDNFIPVIEDSYNKEMGEDFQDFSIFEEVSRVAIDAAVDYVSSLSGDELDLNRIGSVPVNRIDILSAEVMPETAEWNCYEMLDSGLQIGNVTLEAELEITVWVGMRNVSQFVEENPEFSPQEIEDEMMGFVGVLSQEFLVDLQAESHSASVVGLQLV